MIKSNEKNNTCGTCLYSKVKEVTLKGEYKWECNVSDIPISIIFSQTCLFTPNAYKNIKNKK